ncbi:MBL fold metallo-hydrolase [Parachitinimonas caeni]|uniref:MBL fold metallo-hydrolase n=1 Tax=Parachitinimonas caeni TaxID=3031301 RepID=A0ABT7E0G2_9NEIS|nr:MBL fold metallo-hydrolase [Parachitinimonas caeni]MDK2125812.1 MBL fold metallo-hydrolase [Parachitinimonas caeni]
MTELDYPFDRTLPDPGTILPVAPGVYWLRMPLPFQLSHINLWLLDDGDGWTIVDCGYGSDETRALWQQIFDTQLAGRPVRRIVVTHDHPDHIGLADWLACRFEVPVWMTAGEYFAAHLVWRDLGGFSGEELAAHFHRHGISEETRHLLLSGGNSYTRGVPSLPASYHRLREGSMLNMGGARWEVIIGYGHSPEHAALYCAEKRVLIAGDMLLPTISTNVGSWPAEPEGDPVQLFLDSITRFETLPEDTLVLPSHGRPFRGIQPRVEALRLHHQERLQLLVDSCEQPRTAFELIPILFGRDFDLYQTFFALAECVAHLNHLWHTGRLLRHADDQGVLRFGRASGIRAVNA